MSNLSFDLVVIGTGSAGAGAARACRKAGWSVAIVDALPFGGTCALRGCDPKKVLVGVADVVDWCRRMRGRGVTFTDLRIDWADLMRFKRTFTDPVPERVERSFREVGIETFHGPARFVDRTTVQVGDVTLTGRYVLIATGARPRGLGIPGEHFLTTSDRFLDLDVLPSRVVFVGGGYISFEFAHVVARAGAQATILHRGPRPLETFDSDLVDRLVAASRDAGIRVELNTEVRAVESTPEGLRVRARTDAGEKFFEADLVVHGAGRVPNIDGLDLEKAGVAYSARGVTVNEFLQSVSNPAVYAAGDCADSGPPLTPVAGREGQVVAANLLRGNHAKLDYTGVPSVVFTVPPLARVGLLEAQARERGLRFDVVQEDTAAWYASRRVHERYAGFKVLVERETGRILGAHLLGTLSEELINLFALAVQFGLRASDLKEAFYAYPTHASNVPYMV